MRVQFMISWLIQGIPYDPHRPGKWEREEENITNIVIWKDGKLRSGEENQKDPSYPEVMGCS